MKPRSCTAVEELDVIRKSEGTGVVANLIECCQPFVLRRCSK